MSRPGDPLHVTLALAPEQVEAIAERVARLLAERERPPSPLMSYAEAAVFLRCKPQRVRDLVYQHRLTRHAEGGRPLLKRVEVEALVRPEPHPRR